MRFEKGKPKTGGRKRGSRNKRTRKLEEIERSGLAPLDYMLSVMRDPNAALARRDEMARAAAPYLHATTLAKKRRLAVQP
jgi:hypothetical protein